VQFSCPRHPEVEARYHCPRCGQDACEACIKKMSSGVNPVRVHLGCDGMVVDLGGMTDAAAAAARGIVIPLWRRLPEVGAYIARPAILASLVGLAIARWFLGFVPMIGGWIALALEAGVYFRIIETSAHGDPDLTPPDFTDINDAIAPLFRYLAAVAPIVGAFIWAGVSLLGGSSVRSLTDLQGPLILLVVGVLFLPLLLAVAALTRSVVAMYDPRVWVRTLRRFGADYLLAVVLFYALLLGEQVTGFFVALAIIQSPIPVLPVILGQALLYVPMALRGRLLGALCEPYMGHQLQRQPAPPPQARVVTSAPSAAPAATAPAADAPATDRDLVAAARAARAAGDDRQVLTCVNRLIAEHPRSDLIPGALWMVADVQQAAGRADLASKTLRRLIDNYPADPLADAARARLT